MADEAVDKQLREMAQHRGLKLVKSRRRKPGVGDFGKYGLIDAAGKPLLGIDADGLTASAGDIEDYLRTGALSTWRQSAETTPDRPGPKAQLASTEPLAEQPLRRRARSTALADRRQPRNVNSKPIPNRAQASDARGAQARKPTEKPRPVPAKPEAEPALEIIIRSVVQRDAAALVQLLKQLSGISTDRDTIARNLDMLRKLGGGMIVAEQRALVGCCGWAVLPTAHRGPVGRLTVLIVDEKHRRQGIGTQLLVAAQEVLAGKGCALVEAMSDIEIKNAHSFFHALKFEQTSYRFARKIDS